MEFKQETLFQIFVMDSSGRHGIDQNQIILVVTHKSFESKYEADNWIEIKGEADVDYVILEVIRKKRT